MKFKTIVLASTRIRYLEICLLSLKQNNIYDCELYLDGDKNDPNIETNLSTFKKYYPLADVYIFNYSNADLMFSHILLDNMDEQNILLIEDDVSFSHNYIKQSHIFYQNFISQHDEILTFSNLASHILSLSPQEVVLRENEVFPQCNQLGSFFRMDLISRDFYNYIEKYFSLLLKKGHSATNKWIRKDLNFYPNQMKISFDCFYSLIFYSHDKYRVTSAYSKLTNLGIEGTNTNTTSFVDEKWYKNYIIDKIIDTFFIDKEKDMWKPQEILWRGTDFWSNYVNCFWPDISEDEKNIKIASYMEEHPYCFVE